MEKKICAVILGLMLLSIGCSGMKTLNVDAENGSELSSNIPEKIKFAFIFNSDNLYYDKDTGIVYMKNPTYGFNFVYTAYYAPNGLPYKYNQETDMLEEIAPDNK